MLEALPGCDMWGSEGVEIFMVVEIA